MALIALTAAIRPSQPFAFDRAVSLSVRYFFHPAGLPLAPEQELHSGSFALWLAGDIPTGTAKLVSLLGNDFFSTTASLLAVVLAMVLAGRRRLGLTLLKIDLASTFTNQIFKLLRGRIRPTAALMPVLTPVGNMSFPSGHTVHYTVVCCFALWWIAHAEIERRWVRGVLFALVSLIVLAVGWSRIYLGAHWLTDVLAGYLYGFLWFRLGIVVWMPKTSMEDGGSKRDE